MWVRGLKPLVCYNVVRVFASHPVWVRGLKQRGTFGTPQGCQVAPRVGAWIETSNKGNERFVTSVAPRVGAWIETDVRRLVVQVLRVAPRVGAWIETSGLSGGKLKFWSHPVWVRGLKRVIAALKL